MNDAACMVNLVMLFTTRRRSEGGMAAYGQHLSWIASCFSRRALTSGCSS